MVDRVAETLADELGITTEEVLAAADKHKDFEHADERELLAIIEKDPRLMEALLQLVGS